MNKVLLDTDIGSDIDDALCLAYLLSHPQCELLGVTTVSGQAKLRAEMADAMCKAWGKDIPVFPGAEKPLLGESRQPQAPQAAALGDWPRANDFPQGKAVQFLRDTIRANPGEVDLLAIGPLTNIGLLFALDPEIPALLKSLWLMCGHFGFREGRYAEWNALNDPVAAAIVYAARPEDHCSVGLDVTCQCVLDAERARKYFKQIKTFGPAQDFIEVWFSSVPNVTFHDPLTAACIFNRELCRFVHGNIEVELTSPKLSGMTHWEESETGAHKAAADVSPERFFEEYFSVVK